MGFGSKYLRTIGLVALLSTTSSLTSNAQLLQNTNPAQRTQSELETIRHFDSSGTQESSPIFAQQDTTSQELPVYYRLKNKSNNVTDDFREAIKKSELANSSKKMALTVEPVTPQFDTPSQAYRNVAEKLLPYSSLVAVSISKPFENLNGDDHKNYKWDFSVRGSGVVLKTQYKSDLLQGLLVEGSVNDKKDVQLRIPLKQFYLPFLPRKAQISGGINYDLNNKNPGLDKKPSISVFSRW